LTASPWTN